MNRSRSFTTETSNVANSRSAYRFQDRTFSTNVEMVEVLLHEANERIIKIDIGEYENNRLNRNYAVWRLNNLQKNVSESFFIGYKSTYNSLWSQLYRLEHLSGDGHPYIDYIRKKLGNKS
ncbi:hypothetical protein [Bacillus sp. FJAT-45350]|uniref:hypothetical protein n=1 Tax=Bacillus sp. FJAT-45350 TaxID=2011014 RepID=UPI000BB9437B|nr:hypothetical protein [Bacillus sp. FJAT-45350]